MNYTEERVLILPAGSKSGMQPPLLAGTTPLQQTEVSQLYVAKQLHDNCEKGIKSKNFGHQIPFLSRQMRSRDLSSYTSKALPGTPPQKKTKKQHRNDDGQDPLQRCRAPPLRVEMRPPSLAEDITWAFRQTCP